MKKKKKLTVKDVAEAAGVSPATVSRVFNRHPNVTEAVKERIINSARKLGYAPKINSKAKVIALIIPSPGRGVVSGYLGMAIASLSRKIIERGYHMEIVSADDIGLFSNNMICGAVLLRKNKELEQIWSQNYSIPLINVNAESRNIDGIYSVNSDDLQGMGLAIDHLIECGHKRIGLLAVGSLDSLHVSMRVKGFSKALKHYDIPAEENLIRFADSNPRLYSELGKLLKENITALICSGEKTGIIVAQILDLFGHKIPEDISLISYEFDEVSEYCIPAQTTMAQDLDEIALAVIDIIEKLNHGLPAHDTLIDYKLIKRDSVKTI